MQALIGICDALKDPNWSEVEFEPDDNNHKVDLQWTYPAGLVLQQVKSRVGRVFTQNDAESIMHELKGSTKISPGKPILRYEVILAGDWATGLSEFIARNETSNEHFPEPAAKNFNALLEIAGLRIVDFAEANGYRILSSSRNLLARSATTVLQFAAGTRISRQNFISLMESWLKCQISMMAEVDEMAAKEEAAFKILFGFDEISSERRAFFRNLCDKPIYIKSRDDLKRVHHWIELDQNGPEYSMAIPSDDRFGYYLSLTVATMCFLFGCGFLFGAFFSEPKDLKIWVMCLGLFGAGIVIWCGDPTKFSAAKRVQREIQRKRGIAKS